MTTWFRKRSMHYRTWTHPASVAQMMYRKDVNVARGANYWASHCFSEPMRNLLVVGRRDSLNGLGQCGEVDTFT